MGCRKVLERQGWNKRLAPLLDPGVDCAFRSGRPTPASGRASFEAVRLAVDFALRGLVDGIVTAPVSKGAWRSAGIPFLDHTDFLRRACGVRRVAMMLVDGSLRAVPVTRHIPLAQVPRRLNCREVIDAARMAQRALRDQLGIRRPRLGLCALNPHAGESGMLGGEERRILQPALRALKRSGIRIDGPIPADAAWAAHKAGRWDALIALYHDQVMIPMKVADPYAVVNWTLGIPFIRTSPGHGTAFDIAGKGTANPEAMIQAILLAARLCRAVEPMP
jgi:4-hydroxythreonine-4-phosphate dehydrogenase